MKRTRTDEDIKTVAIKRLLDYEKKSAAEVRQELVDTWRRNYPDAAKEVSAHLKPLIRDQDHRKERSHDPDEFWFNDTYTVTLRRHERDTVFGSRGGIIQLGISSLDGTARHDWRDFQTIKNQLAGLECEAFELYPAESRLLDPSNYYTLWCFPGVQRLRVGNEERSVLDAAEALAPQRAFSGE